MILEIVENNFGNNTIEHMSDQTNTIESISEQDNSAKGLLDSYLMIFHALELQPNSSHYRQMKQRMSPEELVVLQYMQKHISHKKHAANKQEGQVPANNRGRKKQKPKEEALAANDNTSDKNHDATDLPPPHPS